MEAVENGMSPIPIDALVLTGYGLNCDNETAHALALAGATPHRVHINALIDGDISLPDYQIMVFGGGFSWGDDHGAGVVQAVRLKNRVGHQLLEWVARGNLVMGICNGFQVLVNLGLLPGLDGDYTRRSVALTHNDCGNFRDDWVRLAVSAHTPCVFTRGLEGIELPIRHGEGKFVTDADTLNRLEAQKQVVLRYANADGRPAGGAFPANPNGSLNDIAGICDPTGRVFGLMPHPEAYHHWTNHPEWTRQKEPLRRAGRPLPTAPTPGVRIFANAVAYLRTA
jgi:phosphoribosylformylglycinamidine synthase